jgi:hypothetical protein
MKRPLAIAACGLSLSACAGTSSWFGGSSPPPAATTMQFESEPAGAEARTSMGQTCRTPCSVAVSGTEFTVSFTLAGYQPQTVPVRAVAATDPVDPDAGHTEGPRLVPNPVFVELQPAAPSPAQRKKPPPPRTAKPKPAAAPSPPPPTAMSSSPEPASPSPPPR